LRCAIHPSIDNDLLYSAKYGHHGYDASDNDSDYNAHGHFDNGQHAGESDGINEHEFQFDFNQLEFRKLVYRSNSGNHLRRSKLGTRRRCGPWFISHDEEALMQINYGYYNDLRSAGFWNFPQLYNTSQEVDVPPIYAPYGTPGFWQPATTMGLGRLADAASSSIAPNSGSLNTVRGAMTAANSATMAAQTPPSTPDAAISSGQGIGPITLVSPMPSITAIPNPAQTPSAPSGWCSWDAWVAANPWWAGLVAVGTFMLISSGGGKTPNARKR
jgi:hypothetical protein